MTKAIVELCKALGQILDANHKTFDPATSKLINALADYVQKNSK